MEGPRSHGQYVAQQEPTLKTQPHFPPISGTGRAHSPVWAPRGRQTLKRACNQLSGWPPGTPDQGAVLGTSAPPLRGRLASSVRGGLPKREQTRKSAHS